MRSTIWVVGITGLVTALGACSGKDHPGSIGAINPGNEGGTRSGTPKGGGSAMPGAGDNAGGAGGSNEASDGPLVMLIEPTTSGPEGAIVGDSVTATCSVKKAHDPIDATSVHIVLKDSDGKVLADQPATVTKNFGEYATEFLLATVPSGAVEVQCLASDTNQKTSTDSAQTFVDHGPTITVVSPMPSSAHPLKGGLDVDFQVAPTLLAKTDPGATVSGVTCTVDGVDVALKQTSPGTFHASVPIDDVNQFPHPQGAISITATDSRAPTPAVASQAFHITIDGEGPVLTIESPVQHAVVGGKVSLIINATDQGSGVDPTTVYATLYQGDDPRYYDPTKGWSMADGKFIYTFDSRTIVSKAQATIDVRATDKVGNPSASGQSVQIYFDNIAPRIDLDPSPIRTTDGKQCSGAFDPVGDLALNDLAGSFNQPPVAFAGRFRAMVWEETNADFGLQQVYASKTDPKTVRLFVQPDPDNAPIKLLVSKNPLVDNICDDIGGVDDVSKTPFFTALDPLNVTERTWLMNDAGSAPSPQNQCTVTDGPQPDFLCPGSTSDIWTTPIRHDLNEPILYAVSPIPTDSTCTGSDWVFATSGGNKPTPEGWICMAVRAVDNVGNVGISPPLRICADNPDTPEKPACATGPTTPPTCTDGCTPPARGGNLIIR